MAFGLTLLKFNWLKSDHVSDLRLKNQIFNENVASRMERLEKKGPFSAAHDVTQQVVTPGILISIFLNLWTFLPTLPQALIAAKILEI